MKYFVISDTHAYYDQTMDALQKAGFFEKEESSKLIILGDLLDRGDKAQKMQEFAVNLLKKDRLIFIRGNHEDLMLCMAEDFEMENIGNIKSGWSYHISNGTFDCALQLTGMSAVAALRYPKLFAQKLKATPFCRTLIPAAKNFFETQNYVFVHGWIPVLSDSKDTAFNVYKNFYYNENWRTADERDFANARWYNGMQFYKDFFVPSKTVVCGHYHASYGHCNIEQRGSEFGKNADFTPFYDKGIIAVDACTAYSGFVNCIVLEDEECTI